MTGHVWHALADGVEPDLIRSVFALAERVSGPQLDPGRFLAFGEERR